MAPSLYQLPPEIRTLIYQQYVGDHNLIDVTIARPKPLTTEEKSIRTFTNTSLSLLRTSRTIFSELFPIVTDISWTLVVRNCSINQLGGTLAALDAELPSWVFDSVVNVQLDIAEFKVCDNDILYFPNNTIGSRINRVPLYEDLCILKSIPLTRLANLRSCHINVARAVTKLNTSHDVASQELTMVLASRRTLYSRLRLELWEIIQHGGDRMKNVRFTAATQAILESRPKIYWKMEFTPAMDEEHWETWVPVRKWQRSASEEAWTECADFDPRQWWRGVTYNYVTGFGIFPQIFV